MSTVQSDNPHASAFASLLFWLCLAIAAGLYAAGALAGRVVEWGDLREQVGRNQTELVNLELQTRQLARVAHALERDPGFAAELARVQLNAAQPGGRQIPLPPALGFDPRQPRPAPVAVEPAELWYLPAARLLASSRPLRWKCQGISAGLLLFAFVFLQGDGSRLKSVRATVRRTLRTVFARYLREPVADQQR